MKNIKRPEKLLDLLLFTLCLSGANIVVFVSKLSIEYYLLLSGFSSFLFAIAIKNLKLGLIYTCIAVLSAAVVSWALSILPALIYGESAMISYITEVFSYFIARFSVLGLPIMLIALLIGSLIVEGI
ncbi:MAG: hypothetical protein QW667_03550 [Candidatus Bathyarchaeia archaeon]